MTTVEENIAKFKLINYIENADSLDKMVLICEKFLEKYKKEDTKKPKRPANVFVAQRVYYHDKIFQEHDQQERKKYIMRDLAVEIGKAIIDSDYVVIEETKFPETMSIKIKATVGVCKP